MPRPAACAEKRAAPRAAQGAGNMSATTRSWVMYDQAEISGDGTPTTLVGCLVGLPTTPLESAARATSEARRQVEPMRPAHPTPSSIGNKDVAKWAAVRHNRAW